MDLLIGIIILLAVISVWVLIMYWGIKTLYKMLKPKIDNITELKGKFDTLAERVELLEKKSDNK